ncbi:MAG: aspartate kinase [Solobacterium sp.]|nr:aspartate kinase [Solobacterium sp.]
MIKVVKFGGSSVASAKQFKRVKKIVQSDASRQFVVTSACGKENKEDYKVTDLLYLCDAHIRYGVSYASLYQSVKDKYLRIKKELKLKTDIEKELNQIEMNMKKGVHTDYLVSRGEYLTGLLLAEYLGYQFLDASEVIAFGFDGEIDMERTKELFTQKCNGKGVLIPGFYGALPNGEIKVMSRGGSDITGSIIANVVDADVYENWTDVSGIYVADPKIIDSPMRVDTITYNELREMSYLGANVLHDDAVFPVKVKNIPINIRNTNEPENPGTLILEDCKELDLENPPHVITGITGRKDFTVITITKSHSSTEVGFLRKILSIFEDYRVSVESVPSTVDTFSVIVASETIESCLYEVLGRLKEEVKPDDLRYEDHLALVAVVGRGMKELAGISGKLLSEFGNNKINIKVISQTADELSIVVGVMNQDFEKAIRCIYEKFITEERSLS